LLKRLKESGAGVTTSILHDRIDMALIVERKELENRLIPLESAQGSDYSLMA
jgi:hypothetical protein